MSSDVPIYYLAFAKLARRVHKPVSVMPQPLARSDLLPRVILWIQDLLINGYGWLTSFSDSRQVDSPKLIARLRLRTRHSRVLANRVRAIDAAKADLAIPS